MCTFVYVHVGQCGIQVGAEFWRICLGVPVKPVPGLTYSSLLLQQQEQEYFLPCILADTETKVIKSLNKGGLVPIEAIHPLNQVLTKKQGCGNNWACGYTDRSASKLILEQVRRNAELCDCFMGVVIFHSTAGGTGSGVTSHLVEDLRTRFPNQYILNIGITPFSSGECSLQSYNSLLLISWLQEYSDGILLMHNDDILKQLPNATSSPSLNDMNKAISKTLANCLQPLDTRTMYSAPSQLITSICPLKTNKFLKSSLNTNGWDIKRSPRQRPLITSNVLCVLRGDRSSVAHIMADTKSLDRKIKELYHPLEWNPFPVDYWFSSNSISGRLPAANDKHMSVLVNSYDIREYLTSVKNRAAIMFDKKAYVHWYRKYGIEEDVFKRSFATVQEIIENYTL